MVCRIPSVFSIFPSRPLCVHTAHPPTPFYPGSWSLWRTPPPGFPRQCTSLQGGPGCAYESRSWSQQGGSRIMTMTVGRGPGGGFPSQAAMRGTEAWSSHDSCPCCLSPTGGGPPTHRRYSPAQSVHGQCSRRDQLGLGSVEIHYLCMRSTSLSHRCAPRRGTGDR